MFGSDYLSHSYEKDHGTHETNDVISRRREYDHDYWECKYAKYVLDSERLLQATSWYVAINCTAVLCVLWN